MNNAANGPTPEIVLDLSRLLSRVRHSAPTGVDRIELAYARELSRRIPERLRFAAVHPLGIYGRIPAPVVLRFLARTEANWASGGAALSGRGGWVDLIRVLWEMRPRGVPKPRGPRVLIQGSHHHLHRERLVRRILRREGGRFVCFIHDLIPIEFPEYARPGGAELHRRRIATVVSHADAIVTNSTATSGAIQPFLDAALRATPVIALLPGLDPPTTASPVAASPVKSPYFICLGTIEPRKNHLLLLHVWRRLVDERGVDAPRLLVVGRRGWENEQVIDLLERCPALTDHVIELGSVPDVKVGPLLAGARALLLASFAEGYGLPVPEAISMKVPVICSDLPALREAGGDVPEYIDPLDGPAWKAMILDYADPCSRARAAQIDRASAWGAPRWSDHVDALLRLAERLA